MIQKRGMCCYLVICGLLAVLAQLVTLLSLSAVGRETTQLSPEALDVGLKNVVIERRPVEGSFNSIPIYYNDKPSYSSTNCAGENHIKNAWKFRSCQFRNLCFHLDTQKFYLFPSPVEQELVQTIRQRRDELVTSSSLSNVTVSIGAINPKWGLFGVPKMEWFPDVHYDLPQSVYELPKTTVMVPYHSFAAFNVGHLVWDDFLPIFTLLEMFGFAENPLLLIRQVLERPLWATCEANMEHKELCKIILKKFLPVMGVDPQSVTTVRDFNFNVKGSRKSDYVCAKHGVAGLGMLSDHAEKLHGWAKADYDFTHNIGRGGQLYAFREFMMNHLHLRNLKSPFVPPYQVTFSLKSSQLGQRATNFPEQIEAVKTKLKDVVVKTAILKEMSLEEQAQLAAESAVFVTACGGGAATATFLERGSSLIVYYDEKGGFEKNKWTGHPARLDWDLLNNAAYHRTHWMPIKSRNNPEQLALLVNIIEYDIELIQYDQLSK